MPPGHQDKGALLRGVRGGTSKLEEQSLQEFANSLEEVWRQFFNAGLHLDKKDEDGIKDLIGEMNTAIRKGSNKIDYSVISGYRNNCKNYLAKIKEVLDDEPNKYSASYPGSGNTPYQSHDADLATQNAQRLQNLLGEEQIRRENAEKERAAAERETQQTTRALNQTKEEVRRLREQVENAEEQVKSAQAKVQLAQGNEQFHLRRADKSEAIANAKTTENEHLRQQLTEALQAAKFGARIPEFAKGLNTLQAALEQKGALGNVPLLRYAEDLLTLCIDINAASDGTEWDPPLGKMDVLLYKPPPPLTQQFFFVQAGNGEGNKAGRGEPYSNEQWNRMANLLAAVLGAQGWADCKLQNLGIVPIFAMRQDEFEPPYHQQDEKSPAGAPVSTDDAQLHGKVEALLRHGYRRRDKVLRPAIVRCYR